jgi:hypothetical protein
MKKFIWKTSDNTLKEKARKIFSDLDKETEYLVIIKRNRPIRSIDHNSYYWIVIKIIAIHTGETKDRLHMLFKALFNSEQFVLPNGDVMTIPATTSDKDSQEFYHYINKVKNWARAEFGVTIYEKEDLDYIKMMEIDNNYERLIGF